MISYGEAIDWCVRHDAVFRFVPRSARREFIFMNRNIPGTKALELAVTTNGKTTVGHAPLDGSKDPSNAIASALIACVQHFLGNQVQVVGNGR